MINHCWQASVIFNLYTRRYVAKKEEKSLPSPTGLPLLVSLSHLSPDASSLRDRLPIVQFAPPDAPSGCNISWHLSHLLTYQIVVCLPSPLVKFHAKALFTAPQLGMRNQHPGCQQILLNEPLGSCSWRKKKLFT